MTEAHEDESMLDIPAGLGAIEDEDEDMGDGEPLDLRKENNAKIIMLRKGASEDGTCASFQLEKEDHTLGNALRWIIMKNPKVDFCGYSMPHPSEDVMNIRVQTYGDITAKDALIQGFEDLMGLCDAVTEKFEVARMEAGQEA